MLQIKFSKQFSSDWDNIIKYIQKDFGTVYADKITGELEKIVKILSVFPEIGKQNLNYKKFRTFIFRKSVTTYTFNSKHIIFLRIVDERNIK